MNVLEAQGLSKRYGRTWALHGCSLSLPPGRVIALVGPNGAGKSTLLHVAVGLTTPTEGTITVLDNLVPGSDDALGRIGFVAQDTPLYRNLSVGDTVRLVASLSQSFDVANALVRLGVLGIPLKQKVGHLSGGQRAQVALSVALARHPELLVLDEPLARLDPLARYEFMATLMGAVAEEGISVLFSSHVVAELERVCDYLVVLAQGRVQVTGEVEQLLATHHVLTGATAEVAEVANRLAVVEQRRGDRQTSLLVRSAAEAAPPPGWTAEATHLEELVLAYLRAPSAAALPGPATSGTADPVRASA